jgi:hypothetical protein
LCLQNALVSRVLSVNNFGVDVSTFLRTRKAIHPF